MAGPLALLTSLVQPALDYALPPRCPACGEIVDGDRRLCLACWSAIDFFSPPWCASCHLPFAFDRGAGAQCAQCLAAPPDHDGVLAAFAYGEIARTLALRLKYGRRIGLARLAADHIARNLPDDMDGWTIVPVPLHRWRLWSRGFNQSMLIARQIGRDRGLRVNADWITRVKPTPPLRGLGKSARAKQMRGAFAVPADVRAAVRGARILLVDDVYASGATSGAIARTLKRAGAHSVVVACWSRVVHDDDRESERDQAH